MNGIQKTLDRPLFGARTRVRAIVRTLVLALFLYLSCASLAWSSQKISEYMQKPKLTVVIVVDQLRADYLTRFYDRFLPAQKSSKVGGFRYLMEKGAYFPFAEYEVLQNMTCPGHATISTGSGPRNTGISLNEWYNRDLKKLEYCAADEQDGLSPRKLKTTTFADEFKNIYPKTKIISLAVKDRSAIMLGGHRADLALWIDLKKGGWETSRFYSASLPAWVKMENSKVQALKLDRKMLAEPLGVTLTIDLAIQALKAERLGLQQGTDFLFISLSSHDISGHQFGMHSPQLEQMTLAEDQQIARLLQEIDQRVGLKKTLLVLTADHGIPPNVETTQSYKIASGKLDYLELIKKVNLALDEKFGQPGSESWFEASKSFHFYLNQKLIEGKKLKSEDVERIAKSVLAKEKGVLEVFTKSEMDKKNFPLGFERLIATSLVDSQWGDIVIIPEPFYMEKEESRVTHMTHYSYDRTVPLIIASPHIKSGVYTKKALIVDLAPTMSFILGSTPPTKNEGRVLF